MNRYKGIMSLSSILSRVNLDLCVCEDNLKTQNEVLKDAIEQIYEIRQALEGAIHDIPSYCLLEDEFEESVACPKCDYEFTEYIYVSKQVPLGGFSSEIACLRLEDLV